MALPNDIVGWILRGTKRPIKQWGIASHQVLKVIQDYSCRIGGVLELYVPEPPPAGDEGVHDMVEVLRVTRVIAGEPFFENVDRVHGKVRALKPRLFLHDPPFVRIFRIREDRLRYLIDMLDRRR